LATTTLSDAVHLQTGLALLHARRSAWVRWPVTAEHVGQSQNTWAPRLGLIWHHAAIAVVRQPEPFAGTTASVVDDLGLQPLSMQARALRRVASQAVRLDNQTATTLELGGRGEAAFGHWQLSVYQPM
jgi:iron complex outermembrane receptor protein